MFLKVLLFTERLIIKHSIITYKSINMYQYEAIQLTIISFQNREGMFCVRTYFYGKTIYSMNSEIFCGMTCQQLLILDKGPTQYGISQLTSHQRSRALADCFDCRDVIKICGQLWSKEQPYMQF